MTKAPPQIPPTLAYTEQDEQLRLRIRSWIESNDMGPLPSEYHPRLEALTEWQAALHSAGFMALSWPTEYGGGGHTLSAEAVLAEELSRSSRPELVNRLAIYTWGPTILDFGTEKQKSAFLPGMLDASEIWCQGFSEPEAGSDLASVRTSGRVEGDSLVINGQKVWTTRGRAIQVECHAHPDQSRRISPSGAHRGHRRHEVARHHHQTSSPDAQRTPLQ